MACFFPDPLDNCKGFVTEDDYRSGVALTDTLSHIPNCDSLRLGSEVFVRANCYGANWRIGHASELLGWMLAIGHLRPRLLSSGWNACPNVNGNAFSVLLIGITGLLSVTECARPGPLLWAAIFAA